MKREDSLKLSSQLCFPLYAASRELTKAYAPLLKEMGLTYPQYLVMMVLWEDGSASVKDLGESLCVDSGTLTPMLKKMESHGLILKTRDPEDQRSVIVSLTKKGSDFKERAYAVPAAMSCMIGLDEAEARSLYALTYKLLHALQAREQS